MKRTHFLARWSALAALDGAVLVFAAPDWGDLGEGLAAPQRWLDSIGASAAAGRVAAAVLWLTAAWLGTALAAAALPRLPGGSQQLTQRLARVLAPAMLSRLLAGGAGLGVVLAPVYAVAAPAPAVTVGAVESLSPAAPSTGALDPACPGLPAPGWPLPAAPTAPTPPATGPGPTPSAEPAATSRATHRVRPGESLWQIAAHVLGEHAGPARVAAEWPRWYAVNSAVIGADPNLIRPGQMLTAPGGPGEALS